MTTKRASFFNYLPKMAGQVGLRHLLDEALGNPNQSTVDFGLLKNFLIQFLIATNQAEFVVKAGEEPGEISNDGTDGVGTGKDFVQGSEKEGSGDRIEEGDGKQTVYGRYEANAKKIARLERLQVRYVDLCVCTHYIFRYEVCF